MSMSKAQAPSGPGSSSCSGAHLNIDVPESVLMCVFDPWWDRGLPLCPMSVYLLLMAQHVMQPIIGETPQAADRARLLAMAAKVPEPLAATSLDEGLKREVCALLAEKDPRRQIQWHDATMVQGPGTPPLPRGVGVPSPSLKAWLQRLSRSEWPW